MSAADATVRLRQIGRLALALSALSLAVVCISAYVRLDAAGLGCSDWPACYGRILEGKANLHTGLARMLHRLGASAALILAFVLAWQCRQPQPLHPVAGRATALAALMIALAAVGLWSADPHRAFVTFINILGGLALVSLSWRVLIAAAPASAAPRTRDPLLAAGIAALVVTMLLGALIGARFAAVSCLTLPACGDTWWPATGGWAALNPLVIVSGALSPGDEKGAALHLLHRYAAATTLLLLGGAAHRGLRRPAARRAAMAVLVLLAVEILLGVLTVAGGFELWLAVGHSANAAMLMAASLWLLER
jgi:cytochrome c oxidase assembly protein subunit 15